MVGGNNHLDFVVGPPNKIELIELYVIIELFVVKPNSQLHHQIVEDVLLGLLEPYFDLLSLLKQDGSGECQLVLSVPYR